MSRFLFGLLKLGPRSANLARRLRQTWDSTLISADAGLTFDGDA